MKKHITKNSKVLGLIAIVLLFTGTSVLAYINNSNSMSNGINENWLTEGPNWDKLDKKDQDQFKKYLQISMDRSLKKSNEKTNSK